MNKRYLLVLIVVSLVLMAGCLSGTVSEQDVSDDGGGNQTPAPPPLPSDGDDGEREDSTDGDEGSTAPEPPSLPS